MGGGVYAGLRRCYFASPYYSCSPLLFSLFCCRVPCSRVSARRRLWGAGAGVTDETRGLEAKCHPQRWQMNSGQRVTTGTLLLPTLATLSVLGEPPIACDSDDYFIANMKKRDIDSVRARRAPLPQRPMSNVIGGGHQAHEQTPPPPKSLATLDTCCPMAVTCGGWPRRACPCPPWQ